MSELFCPATLVLARHGEAEYERQGLSDDGGSLTAAGRRQARQLAEGLVGDRVAAVWCSDLSRSVQTAEIAASILGLTTVTVASGLREVSVGDHRGTPVRAGRLRGALDGVADQYRGETVLVVSHGWAIRVAVTQLCVNAARASSWDLDPGQTAWVSAGAEEWRLRSWAGRPVFEG